VTVIVRPMNLQETARIIEYFHGATPEHLEVLGVDPTHLPPASQWRRLYEQMFDEPVEQRNGFLVSWFHDDQFVGFSTADKISLGQHANMHLHIADPSLRRQGVGTECVRQSAHLYFDFKRQVSSTSRRT
jgi:ribosomal protein S18 acetylase RimI-like enzyme